MHDNMKNTSQRTVVITGASSGIGLGIAQAFAKADYRVVVFSRQARGVLKGLGHNAVFIPCDVRLLKNVEQAMAEAAAKTGRLDVLVNCAGFSQWKPLAKIDEAFLSQMLDVNLKGAFWGAKAALRYLKDGASIINIASLAGKPIRTVSGWAPTQARVRRTARCDATAPEVRA